ncbi:MAG: hypothetical protein ABMB14_20525, partial [Myxococcota bacterium]
MVLLTAMTVSANAGVAFGLVGGYDAPIERGTTSDAGPTVGAVLGYRADLAILHLQPESLATWSSATPA